MQTFKHKLRKRTLVGSVNQHTKLFAVSWHALLVQPFLFLGTSILALGPAATLLRIDLGLWSLYTLVIGAACVAEALIWAHSSDSGGKTVHCVASAIVAALFPFTLLSLALAALL